MSAFLEDLLLLYARRFPIRRGKLRVIDALWRAAAGGQGAQRVARLKYGHFAMPCDLTEMMQRQFYFFGTYFLEDHILGFWQNAAREAEVIFDVGANAGIYSLAALAAQPAAVVHAFEPTPEIAARLRATAGLNRLAQLHVHEAAVLDENGFASLYDCRGESGTNEGMNFVRTGLTGPGARRVEAVRLDQFCQEHAIDRIDLLKLDIQGQEHAALAGAGELLRKGRIGTVLTELNWASGPGSICPAAESIRMLDDAGYSFAKPGGTLDWSSPGSWLRSTSDVAARRIAGGEAPRPQ